MERPEVLTLFVTNRCPLKCSHCGPRSGPPEKERLDLQSVSQLVEAASRRGCQSVNLSGGEPFLLEAELEEMISEVKKRNLRVRVTTGCYWSSTLDKARKRLAPLALRGLEELVESIVNAVVAAHEFGIRAVVAVVTSNTAAQETKVVRDAFESAGQVPLDPTW